MGSNCLGSNCLGGQLPRGVILLFLFSLQVEINHNLQQQYHKHWHLKFKNRLRYDTRIIPGQSKFRSPRYSVNNSLFCATDRPTDRPTVCSISTGPIVNPCASFCSKQYFDQNELISQLKLQRSWVGGISEVTSGPQMTPSLLRWFLEIYDRKKNNNLLCPWNHTTSITSTLNTKPQRCLQLSINLDKK